MRYFLVDKDVFKKDMNMYEKVIYAVLCKFANADGKCFPSRRTIAKNGGFSVSTYNKYVSKMLEKDVVTKETRFRKNMSQTSNLFDVNRDKKNSFPVRSDILNFGLTSRALCVYICLSMYVAEDNCCRVSQHTLAKTCSMSLSSVIKAICELKNNGLVETYRQNNVNDNGNYVLLYRLAGEEHRPPVTKRKVDVCNTKIESMHVKKITVPKTVARIVSTVPQKCTPLYMTHSPYVSDTLPELYLL